MLPLVLALALTRVDDEPPPRPFLLGSFTISAFSGFPDVIGGSAIVHAIPFVDIEATTAFELFGLAASLRAGPRFTVGDWRNESNRGWTLRLSLLGGARWLRLWGHNSVARISSAQSTPRAGSPTTLV